MKTLASICLLLLSVSCAPVETKKETAIDDQWEERSQQTRTALRLPEVDKPPVSIRIIEPLYPFAARRKGIQGTVTLRFIVNREGKVVEPSAVEGEPPGVFDVSVLKAILRWRFKPAIKNGKAVDVTISMPVHFGPIGVVRYGAFE